MLSKDNPEYKNKREKVNTRPNPRDYRPVKSIAYNPYVSGDNAPSDKWGKGLMSSTQGNSRIAAWKDQNNGLMEETSTTPVSDKKCAIKCASDKKCATKYASDKKCATKCTSDKFVV